MISIAEAISDLLFVRDVVVVPGLGAFVKKATSAKVNPVANYFAMPSSELSFDANLREDNDLIVSYLSEKNEIPADEARRLLVMFVSDCFNSMKMGKKVLLKDVGTLYYDWADDLTFEQEKGVNYNSDAFGLCDFSPEPILRSKTKEEIKEEIEQRQRDKNTPITVDEKAVHKEDKYDDGDEPRRLGWMWVLLTVLLLAGIGYGLYYFKVIDFSQWANKPIRGAYEPKTYALPSYSMDWDEAVEKVVETIKTRTPVHEGNILIIAGCFDQEENAARLTNSLKNKGYTGAFYELHGKQWYVSFGRYVSEEQASAVLREIRANTEYKAWIKK
ncbi:MAG: SPOR domain-containing protein [Bacteroidales bacterium]|nr:SPOR domain-containing protein [Bacteroidales bacterium]